MKGEVFVLTTEPPEHPGGVERLVGYLTAGLRARGYGVRVFHRENCASARWRHPRPERKLEWLVAGLLQGYFIGRAARRMLHPNVRLVLSNATVGWFPVGGGVRQAHFYHGTYRGQAEAIRPFISRGGYLKLKWWDAMVLERWSGGGKLCLCNSDRTREEVRRFFGHEGVTVWYPLDTGHFCPLARGECRRLLGLADDGPVGLFVGSTHPQKGFATVQWLMETFPQVHWVIALRGDLPARPLKGRVRLFQNASYDQLPILYNAADFSLCCSWYEPFGYVLAEALACGTPVIATPGGASGLFLAEPPFRRLLVDSPGDREGFGRAVQDVLDRPGQWRERVREEVRPRLIALMAPGNWWQRFLSCLS